jgi:hypothetical protein
MNPWARLKGWWRPFPTGLLTAVLTARRTGQKGKNGSRQKNRALDQARSHRGTYEWTVKQYDVRAQPPTEPQRRRGRHGHDGR